MTLLVFKGTKKQKINHAKHYWSPGRFKKYRVPEGNILTKSSLLQI
jgi:hypothetical protein